MKRRTFLGIGGLSVLALGAGRALGPVLSGADADADATRAVGAGTRWAMLVDMRKCAELPGCTRCVVACHTRHNVPQSTGETAHDVRWIWKERYAHAFTSEQDAYVESALETATLPVLCNHCDRPPCVRVCPTKATFKREDGVVMMDWHRCIGCRYCMAACPYGSRSFNWQDPRPHIAHISPDYPTRTKGVVEKCTFCDERLAKGVKPACVEACPNGGLVFGNLADANSAVRGLLRERHSMRRKPQLGTGPAVYYLV